MDLADVRTFFEGTVPRSLDRAPQAVLAPLRRATQPLQLFMTFGLVNLGLAVVLAWLARNPKMYAASGFIVLLGLAMIAFGRWRTGVEQRLAVKGIAHPGTVVATTPVREAGQDVDQTEVRFGPDDDPRTCRVRLSSDPTEGAEAIVVLDPDDDGRIGVYVAQEFAYAEL